MIEIPVSTGELIDKITILEIKQQMIKDPTLLDRVNQELALLESRATAYRSELDQELSRINYELWRIEDAKRRHEQEQRFDQEFIELARKVYILNDQRALIKREINQRFNSTIQEVKSYWQ